MVKKYQKGVFERLNWYKKKEQLNFPYLHFNFKNENIFNLVLNNIELSKRFKTVDEMLYNLIEIMYFFERRYRSLNHKDFSIFCTKYNNSNKKIFFYKGN